MRGALALLALAIAAQADARARDLGIPFEGKPGPLNAITDVNGVEVGQETLIEGEGPLKVGVGPIRTGVTVVLPRGRADGRAVYGGFFDLNGNGEMTGRAYLEDFGIVQGPIGLTDSNAIGQVYAGIQQWSSKRTGAATWPVVAETWSGYLNDIEGFHVTAETAMAALDSAKAGPVQEGNVGGGTGMVCFGFKGGIGTASRVVSVDGKGYTVGVLVQCNTGDRKVLRIAGAPAGQALAKRWLRCFDAKVARASSDLPPCAADGMRGTPTPDEGSIIIVVATDAPLTPLQLNRVARRAAMGLARLGSYSGNQSGDLIVSFSTAAPEVNAAEQGKPSPISPLGNLAIDPLFEGATEATEEAIVNALVAARTMTGINGTRVYGIPHDELRSILKRYNRLEASK
ncbi:MAG TPA: P1 family peptidase [Sphingomicrobium sp.]|nr:P1 family peptidase [Sphingomicrobium sp.]